MPNNTNKHKEVPAKPGWLKRTLLKSTKLVYGGGKWLVFFGINKRNLTSQVNSLRQASDAAAPSSDQLRNALRPATQIEKILGFIVIPSAIVAAGVYFVSTTLTMIEEVSFESVFGFIIALLFALFVGLTGYTSLVILLGKLREDNPVLKPLGFALKQGMKIVDPRADSAEVLQLSEQKASSETPRQEVIPPDGK